MIPVTIGKVIGPDRTGYIQIFGKRKPLRPISAHIGFVDIATHDVSGIGHPVPGARELTAIDVIVAQLRPGRGFGFKVANEKLFLIRSIVTVNVPVFFLSDLVTVTRVFLVEREVGIQFKTVAAVKQLVADGTTIGQVGQQFSSGIIAGCLATFSIIYGPVKADEASGYGPVRDLTGGNPPAGKTGEGGRKGAGRTDAAL